MKRLSLVFFLVTFSLAMGLAMYTDHKWEDWYITYRAAKNLATGNGLVYHIGERLMTYTSPIGTLIPASLKFIFSNQSDEFVIWGYRIICSLVLSFTPILILRIFHIIRTSVKVPVFVCVLFITNFLIIDNTINGMESAFMVLLTCYLLLLLISPGRNNIWQWSFCFAGLMYSRPDGFVYGGACIVGIFLFNEKVAGLSRPDFLKMLVKPLLVSILLFSPWLLWTWFYYGTPIPHTIIAKSRGIDGSFYLDGFVKFIFNFKGHYPLLLPPYPEFGGWPGFTQVAKVITFVSSLYWVNIKATPVSRALSFTTFLMLAYLMVVSGQGARPWYLPTVALPTVMTLGLIVNEMLNLARRRESRYLKHLVYLFSVCITIFMMITFILGAIQIKHQQQIVESGNRKNIGLWLRDNKKEGDRVFMECLGYIGFFSEMKTLDFPGMSSPEVVAARKHLASNHYATLINYLEPDWLVLRPGEITRISDINPDLLEGVYSLVKEFDVTEEVNKSPVKFGKPYLLVDSKFSVYKRSEVTVPGSDYPL